MEKIIVFLFFIWSLNSFSQISFYNNVVTDEDNLSRRNYNGSNVKELKVVGSNMNDSLKVGRMVSQKFFDISGNIIKDVSYNVDSSISKDNYYKYDSLNRLVKVVGVVYNKNRNDTTIISKIKYDKLGNIKSIRITFANTNYAVIKNYYHSGVGGLLKYQKMEYFYNYNIHYYRGDNRATLGYGQGSNWTIFWRDFQYYNELGIIRGKNIAGNKVLHELYKVDKNYLITEGKSLEEDKTIYEFSLFYNDNRFLIQKIEKLNQGIPILLKYLYTFYN